MRKSLLGAVAMLSLLPMGAVLAQSEAPTAPDPGMGAPVIPEVAAPEAGALGDFTAEELRGRELVDATGESVGTIQDVLVSERGEVVQVMVDVGTFLGVGGRTVAIDPFYLTVEEGDGSLVVGLTREEIEALPAWEQREGVWQPAAG
jgi:hypothetical protein